MEMTCVIEAQMRGMVKAGVSPQTILTAFHNACCHGEIIDEAGGSVEDKYLSELFDGFDKSAKALEKMLS